MTQVTIGAAIAAQRAEQPEQPSAIEVINNLLFAVEAVIHMTGNKSLIPYAQEARAFIERAEQGRAS